MTEMEKVDLPQIRFNEFHGVLRKQELGHLVKFEGGSQPPRDTFKSKPEEGYIRLIQIRDYKTEKYLTFIPTKLARKFCDEKDVMIGRYGPPIFQILRGLVGAYNVALIKALPIGEIDREYLYYFLIREPLFKLIESLSRRTSGQTGIDMVALKSFPVFLPSLPEQQKIAAFLSAVDQKIQLLQRKKELLEQYKKGVMQKIFSQEIRFKDANGNDYPDWEEMKIKQFVLSNKGSMKIGPFGSQLKRSTFVESGYKVYGQENIFIDDFDYGDRFITDSHFNSLKSNEIIAGDFVISTMGTIGKSSVVPFGIQRGIMDSHMIRLQLDVSIITTDFLAQLFISYATQKQIKRFSVGGIMDGLSMGIINELRFWVPSIGEQSKIAQTLSILDGGIENIQNQLSFMIQFKKGLLQKMFV
jgi:type I restriction enzyme, S subunit